MIVIVTIVSIKQYASMLVDDGVALSEEFKWINATPETQ